MMNSSRAKHCLSTLYSAGGEMIINTNLQTTDAIGICVFLTKSSSPQVQLDVKRSTTWRVSKRAFSLVLENNGNGDEDDNTFREKQFKKFAVIESIQVILQFLQSTHLLRGLNLWHLPREQCLRLLTTITPPSKNLTLALLKLVMVMVAMLGWKICFNAIPS
jgi:hypothetical protein